jgi:hypothetical protein|tara:strand:- start:263 stop:709 length:447 start_codon:yes stop_codon:yes gene_type:complete
MAGTLTPTLTLVCSDLTSDATNFTVTDSLSVTAPAGSVQKISTAANPLNAGAGILLTEAASTATTFVYVKHTGKLASDGTTACHASNDFIKLSNEDGDMDFIKLQPEEFCFFPLMEFDGSDGGVEAGGLKVEAGSAAVMIEFAYWTRS